ncbi:hypothetical protein ANN_26031 [Periplaneta americana]|uniref:Uncharacterized protein n=1 Tax=Periplaneta americana TaxID=6978 RepID=A0ABQ8S5C3_PERAM|nr:hypothetical protein ANN_26031 [Periplaneta americana]
MKNWSDDSEHCVVSASDKKDDRIVVTHCGGQAGFIEDALFITHKSMADAPGDYHGTMNATIFTNWFANSILKRLQEPSVIVCANA